MYDVDLQINGSTEGFILTPKGLEDSVLCGGDVWLVAERKVGNQALFTVATSSDLLARFLYCDHKALLMKNTTDT